MNRNLVASARKKLLRRGRSLLRRSKGSSADALGGMNEGDLGHLREIHAALERIERGIFGRCESCHENVEAEKLETAPWERECAACREEAVTISDRPPANLPAQP